MRSSKVAACATRRISCGLRILAWIVVEASSTHRYLASIILQRFDCLRLKCLAWIVLMVSSTLRRLASIILRRFAELVEASSFLGRLA